MEFIICIIIVSLFYYLLYSIGNNNPPQIPSQLPQQLPPNIHDVQHKENVEIKKQTVNLNDITKYVYIDTETSSLEVDRGEVLQLSAIKIETYEENGSCVLNTFNEYIKPSEFIRIDPKAMKVNGISLSKCQCPKSKAFKDFLDFCEGHIICGYNVKFDIDMLEDDMRKEGINIFDYIIDVKDVLQVVRDAMLPTANNKLTTISEYLGFHCENYHNSLFDSLATMFVDMKLSFNLSINYYNILDMIKQECENTCPLNDEKCQSLFNGQNVCISGDFSKINRKYLENKIVECGGIVKGGMSKRVNIFINGYNFKPTNKEKKYEELVNNGCDNIVKYNEDTLLEKIC